MLYIYKTSIYPRNLRKPSGTKGLSPRDCPRKSAQVRVVINYLAELGVLLACVSRVPQVFEHSTHRYQALLTDIKTVQVYVSCTV